MYKKFLNIIKIIQYLENWPIFFLDYLGLVRSKRIIYRFRNGIKLIVRSQTVDSSLINAIWIKKEYNRLSGFDINKNDTVIDVGAHIGIFSILAASKTKEGKVYSYEPSIENFKLLKENIEINALKNVEIFNLAVWSKKEEKDFFFHKEGGDFFVDYGMGKKKIFCTTLKDIFETNKIEKVDFLKMDCEGVEAEILLNTPQDIFKKIDKIVLEYHNNSPDFKNKLKLFLKNQGFEVTFFYTPNWLLYAKKNKCE